VKTALTIGNIHVNIASRGRRRWLVAALYATLAAVVTAWFLLGNSYSAPTFALFVVFALGVSFMGGQHHRRGLVPSYEGGDERERTRRYKAHYKAYIWLDLMCIPALFAAFAVNSPEARHAGPAAQLLVGRLAWSLLIAAGILYYTLPQAILLWTEPDMEAPQP
jgi:MFS family permease